MTSTAAIGSQSTLGDYLKILQGSDDTKPTNEAANSAESTPQPTPTPDRFSLRPNPAQNLYYM